MRLLGSPEKKERAVERRYTSLIKEAHKFSEELGMELELSHLRPFCRSQRDPDTVINRMKVKQHLRRTVREKIKRGSRGTGRGAFFMQDGKMIT